MSAVRGLMVAGAVLLLLSQACAGEFPKKVRISEAAEPAVTVKILTEDGGHLGWSWKKNKIAFDRLERDGYFDLWIMNPDGTGQKCLTCDHPQLPNRHIGDPDWHPSGDFLVIQVQKPSVPRRFDKTSVPGSGVLNDLFIITSDGKKVWPLVTVSGKLSKDSEAVLHPHFSHDGRKLFWSQRVSGRGKKGFGEWVLHIADFKFDKSKGPSISNDRIYNPGGKTSFFESHSFSPDDRHVLFTGNQDGPLEIYEMEVSSGRTNRLTRHSRRTWDEHAHYSPNGKKILYMSSEGLVFRIIPSFKLETEFWIMNRDGSDQKRLTFFHQKGSVHYMNKQTVIAADPSWGPDGKTVVALVINNLPDSDKRGSGAIVLISNIDTD